MAERLGKLQKELLKKVSHLIVEITVFGDRFTLMQIFDFRKNGINQYQFITPPKEHTKNFDSSAQLH